MGCVNGKCLSQQSSSSPNESRNDKENAGIGVENRELNAANIATENVCEVVRVPAYGYELKYAYLSHRGYYPEAPDKANQDSFCIHTRFKNNPNDHFFGVFDGHGQYGAQCSEFVKKKLCEHLVKDPLFSRDVVQAYHSAFRSTNADLHNSNSIDDSMSGTTAITVLVRGKTLFVANVGDSRALIAEKRGNGIVAVDLSSDQTPFRADECDRVKLCGARVLSLDQLEGLKDPNIQYWGTEENDDGGDPPRLWVPNGNYPGTAFTRSVGDDTAESIGVIAVPEVTVLELTADHPFFVVASDGVFEFLSSQAVVDMVPDQGGSIHRITHLRTGPFNTLINDLELDTGEQGFIFVLATSSSSGCLKFAKLNGNSSICISGLENISPPGDLSTPIRKGSSMLFSCLGSRKSSGCALHFFFIHNIFSKSVKHVIRIVFFCVLSMWGL
eukprot:Gb_23110 [translate_table: standard]